MKTILFVCVHNAGRSQMAEAFLNKVSAERGLTVRGVSAGTVGGDKINSVAMEAMSEVGISMEDQHPKQITSEMIDQAERIITMGCGVETDSCPARFYVTEDWGLDDPKGQPIEAVRVVRDQIRERIDQLVDEMEAE